MTMLTVDTHFEDGYICEQCGSEYGENQYADVIACSSRQVAEFVNWIQQQDFYENTTIVIVGDHPTMDSDFCENVGESYNRRVYTAYINSATEAELSVAREYTIFDNFPTTLAAIGAEIEGERLGLGTNLFSSVQTLSERFGLEMQESELKKKSSFMMRLQEIKVAGEILVEETEDQTDEISVKVQNVVGEDQVEKMKVAVWTEEDQSDIRWLKLKKDSEGNYIVLVDMNEFQNESGECYVHVYVTTVEGEEYLIGGRETKFDL